MWIYVAHVRVRSVRPDFLFEAIKTEREGIPLHYLEAMEALSLSPVEFFHAHTFSMKFAAPILLAAARGQEHKDPGGVHGYQEADSTAGTCCKEENDEVALMPRGGLFVSCRTWACHEHSARIANSAVVSQAWLLLPRG